MSVNHRLNALGFLDLSEIGGPAYAESANVGMTDLVAGRVQVMFSGGGTGLPPVRAGKLKAAIPLAHAGFTPSVSGSARPASTRAMARSRRPRR